MPTAAHLLRINAVELLRHPGATRHVEAVVPPAELGVHDQRVAGDVQVDVTATSSIDGVVVHGTARTPWRTQCRRCLADVAGIAISEIDEVFQHQPRDVDSLEIAGDQIDLAPVVREYVLLDLPDAPLCRDDCAGICPDCGADRNENPCDCASTVLDPRWSALEDLHLDE